MTNDLIEARLTRVTERVARAAERVGRSPEDIQILPVTKGHSKLAIESIMSLGLDCIGAVSYTHLTLPTILLV